MHGVFVVLQIRLPSTDRSSSIPSRYECLGAVRAAVYDVWMSLIAIIAPGARRPLVSYPQQTADADINYSLDLKTHPSDDATFSRCFWPLETPKNNSLPGGCSALLRQPWRHLLCLDLDVVYHESGKVHSSKQIRLGKAYVNKLGTEGLPAPISGSIPAERVRLGCVKRVG